MTKDEIILAQQARIEQLRETLQHFALIDLGRDSLPSTFGMDVLASRKALSPPDDLSALRSYDAALIAKHIEICKKLAAENEGLAGEVWCERCADAIKKGGVCDDL